MESDLWMPMDHARVGEARRKMGLSVRQFGRAIGLSAASAERKVRRWEAGEEPVPGPAATAIRYVVTHGLDDTAREAAYGKVA